jgi:7,8-dihydropterin-6-yl-methyl-4-(beta-D-ribofuranosyl)aminobenzene 5'-phosphate synthase
MSEDLLRITVLVDNQAANGLLIEHGLSLWVETPELNLLFDTGQGGVLSANAEALGVDLSQADNLVLSHGHYDHSGGVAQVLNGSSRVEVHAHPGVVQRRYSVRDGQARLISMPPESKAALDRLPGERLHWVSKPTWITETIGITGPIERQTLFEDTGGPFFVDPEGRRADPIEDDLALWLRTAAGLVVCAGCCHAGLINTLFQIQRLDPGHPIQAVIGGFHLVSAAAERLAQTAAAHHRTAARAALPLHRRRGHRLSSGGPGGQGPACVGRKDLSLLKPQNALDASAADRQDKSPVPGRRSAHR